MAFVTMVSPNSHPLLFSKKVKKITHLTQCLLNLFELHLFLLDPNKTLSFFNWWHDVKEAFSPKGIFLK